MWLLQHPLPASIFRKKRFLGKGYPKYYENIYVKVGMLDIQAHIKFLRACKLKGVEGLPTSVQF
jgi:hypothetical protein